MPVMPSLPRTWFGAGCISELPDALALLGSKRPLLVSDRNLSACGVVGLVEAALKGRTAWALFDQVPENPTSAGVHAALAAYRDGKCDGIIAVGGGSVIDTGKMLSIMAVQGGAPEDYLGQPARVQHVAPLVVLPTTAGTGSEASPSSSIHPTAEERGLGVASALLVPRCVFLDPELTYTLPPRLTAATGMDALSHCIEGVFSSAENPFAEAMALDGMARVARWLPRALANPRDPEARGHMMAAAYMGGVAIHKGLGPAHAIAIACGDRDVNHGVLSNIGVLASLDFVSAHAPDRAARLAAAMGLAPGRSLLDGVLALSRETGLPLTLSAAGYPIRDLEELSAAALATHFNRTAASKPTLDDYRRMLAAVA